MNIVIGSQAEWEGQWTRHVSIVSPAPPLPEVDFETHMVLCAFMGTKSSGGYSIKITKYEQEGEGWKVYCETTSPSGMATMALTQPYHMVKVAKHSQPVEFVVGEAAPPPVTELTFNICVADPNKDASTGTPSKVDALTGFKRKRVMFSGAVVTVVFDAAATSADAAAKALGELEGVTSVEADMPMQMMGERGGGGGGMGIGGGAGGMGIGGGGVGMGIMVF